MFFGKFGCFFMESWFILDFQCILIVQIGAFFLLGAFGAIKNTLCFSLSVCAKNINELGNVTNVIHFPTGEVRDVTSVTELRSSRSVVPVLKTTTLSGCMAGSWRSFRCSKVWFVCGHRVSTCTVSRNYFLLFCVVKPGFKTLYFRLRLRWMFA